MPRCRDAAAAALAPVGQQPFGFKLLQSCLHRVPADPEFRREPACPGHQFPKAPLKKLLAQTCRYLLGCGENTDRIHWNAFYRKFMSDIKTGISRKR